MVVAARLENSLLQYSAATAAERQRLPFMRSFALTYLSNNFFTYTYIS